MTKEVGVRKEVTHILWQVVIDIFLTVANGSVQLILLSRCQQLIKALDTDGE